MFHLKQRGKIYVLHCESRRRNVITQKKKKWKAPKKLTKDKPTNLRKQELEGRNGRKKT